MGVPQRVTKNRGVQGNVPWGVSGAHWAAGSRVSKSASRVSKVSPPVDTPGTLSGHCLDTPKPRARLLCCEPFFKGNMPAKSQENGAGRRGLSIANQSAIVTDTTRSKFTTRSLFSTAGSFGQIRNVQIRNLAVLEFGRKF